MRETGGCQVGKSKGSGMNRTHDIDAQTPTYQLGHWWLSTKGTEQGLA